MSRNAVVYESRNRITGTLMRTIDTRHPDAAKLTLRKRTKAEEQMRYAAQCVDHNTVVFFAEHYPAGRAIAHSGDADAKNDPTAGWCAKCVTMAKAGNKVERPKEGAPATAKPAPKSANTKRTSDKKANRAAQRKANAAAKPSEVTTHTEPPAETEPEPEATPEPVAAATE